MIIWTSMAAYGTYEIYETCENMHNAGLYVWVEFSLAYLYALSLGAFVYFIYLANNKALYDPKANVMATSGNAEGEGGGGETGGETGGLDNVEKGDQNDPYLTSSNVPSEKTPLVATKK